MSYVGHIVRMQGSLKKIMMLRRTEGGRKRGRLTMRWLDSTKEATGVSLQELSRAVCRILWVPLMCLRVPEPTQQRVTHSHMFVVICYSSTRKRIHHPRKNNPCRGHTVMERKG